MVRPSDYENEQMNKKQKPSLDLPDLSSMLEYKLEVTQSHFIWANKIKTNNYIYLTVWLCRTDDKEVDPDIKKKLKLEIHYQNSDHPLENQKILIVGDTDKLTIYGSSKTIIPIQITEVSQKHDHKNFNVLIKAVDDYNTYSVKTDAIYVVSVLKSNEIIANKNSSDSNQTTTSAAVVANNHLEDQTTSSTKVNAIIPLEDESKYSTTVINNQPIQQQSSQQKIEFDDEQFKNIYIDPDWHKIVSDEDFKFDSNNHLEVEFNDSTILDAIIQIEDQSMSSPMAINNQPFQQQSSQQNFKFDEDLLPSVSLIRDSSWWWCSS